MACTAAVVGIDQSTKALAVSSLERGESVNVFIGIDLTNVRNTGVAFGLLSDGGDAIAVFVAVAVLALLAYFAVHASRDWLWLPVGMVVGGAVGNFVDRAGGEGVVDFIDPVAWPAFNLADVAIVVGMLGVLYVSERRPEVEVPA